MMTPHPKNKALHDMQLALGLLQEVSSAVQGDGYIEEDRIIRAIEYLQPALEVVGKVPQSNLVTSRSTELACSSCHRIGADTYYLKKSAGKYAVLCFDNGHGCWEKSARTCCSYTDQYNAQCESLVEFEVVYGKDGVSRRAVCGLHVGAVLNSDVSQYTIYPIDED